MLPVCNSGSSSPASYSSHYLSWNQFQAPMTYNNSTDPLESANDDVDYDFACDSLEDDSIDGLYSSSDDDEDFDDTLENKDNESEHLPFWYSNEEPSHIARIIKSYARLLDVNAPSSPVHDFRRLPSFVGRIERQPVMGAVHCEEEEEEQDEFTTLDVVQIYRRDIRQVGSTVSLLEEKTLLTSWDEDGVPVRFHLLKDPEEIEYWTKRSLVEQASFVYCEPVWRSNVEFFYEVSPERKLVGYAKEPFNFTKYIPQHYLVPVSTGSD